MRFSLQPVFFVVVVVAVKTCQIMLMRAGKVHWAIPVVDFPSETIGMAVCMAVVATVVVVGAHMTNQHVVSISK